MEHVIPYCHRLLQSKANPNSTCIDFTAGNGNDTLFLSKICPKGQVYSFDIQEQATANTQTLLKQHKITNAKVILDSHEYFDKYVTAFDVGVFNLGYLPKGSTQIATQANTTVKTLQKALQQLSPGGLLTVVCYINHPGGAEEASKAADLFESLDDNLFVTTKYQFLNKKTAPFVLAAEKRKEQP